jgi:hypothetical protein
MNEQLILSPEDEELRNSAHKHKSGRWVIGSRKYGTRWLHRVIAIRRGDNIKGFLVDHKNLNVDDNTRDNLRLATNGQNRANSKINKNNSSEFKGVHFKGRPEPTGRKRRSDYQEKNWYAQINVNGKKLFIGQYATAEEAGRAYEQEAIKHFGEFARSNMIDK